MTLTEMAEQLRYMVEELESERGEVTPCDVHNFAWKIVEATREEALITEVKKNIEEEYK